MNFNKIRTLVVAGAVIASCATPSHAAGKKGSAGKPAKEAVVISADSATFMEVAPGVSKSLLWGSADKGAYGAFTRFAPGVKNPLHTHTLDAKIVVLKGAYVYKTDAGEKRVGPGGYIFIPGGMKHESWADEKEGALFYEELPGKFDMVFVK